MAAFVAVSKPRTRSAPTKKGQETRARILAAGRETLSERGYFGATVAEIAEKSSLSLGAIYRYFANKDLIFLEILEEVTEELFTAVSGSWTKGSELESLRESSRRYLTTYYDNRRLIAGLIEMSAAVPECAERWWNLKRRTFRRKELYLRRHLPTGDLNPEYASVALATMVDQLAFHWYIESEKYGGEAPTIEEAAETVSLIWYRSIYATGTGADGELR
ncbi:TetR/AcrR family transcriptional regulator [Nocardia asteroides]|uniref:TetR/AcrR family transcriptional regulator n=1 Tax=Nocardia asteroides TaxID=1824 RepID=UPI003419066B